ncbi:MAG TPA: histidinol dehydrogenase [Flavisolibacter sp.]|jgi:histidinol dehydrogenase|nr:histidinol dehydrogenase [Flavisolibacter sp.]
MQVFENPPKEQWNALLQRPYTDSSAVLDSVQLILNAVKEHGDEAIWSFTKKFDGVELKTFSVSETEIDEAEGQLSETLKQAILTAKENIETFHRAQVQSPEFIETMPGIRCWRKSVGIDRVGLYIPGGSAPLFSTVLMLAVPAVLAGCKEIILCTPCNREGCVHPAILFAARLTGVTHVYKIGGAQAIAAMAYGTETIPPVYKIFGPGNQYVTIAKQLIQVQGVAIDMPAGPSEVCIWADEGADASFIAADLLSQAEHGPDSQVLLVTDSPALIAGVQEELTKQLEMLPRKNVAEKALENSKAILVKAHAEALALINEYGAEHLIINAAKAEAWAEQVTNAGSVFIGAYSPESVGDYASGTNHTLPTNGFSRAYSGVSVDSFVKKITFQQLTAAGLQQLAGTVITMAEAEGLQAHANAVRVRLNQPNSSL